MKKVNPNKVLKVELLFAEMPFYTLQEACDYLKLVYNLAHITPQKLLKLAVLTGCELLTWYREPNPELKTWINADVETFMNVFERYPCKVHFSLSYLNQVLLQTDTGTQGLRDFLRKPSVVLEDSHLYARSMIEGLARAFSHGGFLFLKHEDAKEMVIHGKVSTKNFEFFLPTQERLLLKNNRIEQGDYLFSYYAPFFAQERTVGLDDVLLLDDDLIHLIEKLQKRKLLALQTMPDLTIPFEESKGHQGISAEKIEAKNVAIRIARKKWQEDTEQAIKMLEMASEVYAQLYTLGYKEVLPENQGALKEWIKDVAPAYAREGGRPRKEKKTP